MQSRSLPWVNDDELTFPLECLSLLFLHLAEVSVALHSHPLFITSEKCPHMILNALRQR